MLKILNSIKIIAQKLAQFKNYAILGIVRLRDRQTKANDKILTKNNIYCLVITYALISERSGRAIPNQQVVEINNQITFCSYGRHVAMITNEGIFLNKLYWNYSRTTNKYLAQFLRERGQNVNGKKDIEKLIKQGVFKLF